jgi:hypothetical protein
VAARRDGALPVNLRRSFDQLNARSLLPFQFARLAMNLSNNDSGVVAIMVVAWPGATKDDGWGIRTSFAVGSYDMEFIGSREDAEAARRERMQEVSEHCQPGK